MDKPQGRLTPGGLAMIVRCKLSTENVGKIVTTVRCFGILAPGEIVVYAGRRHLAAGSTNGAVWAVESPDGIWVPRRNSVTGETLPPALFPYAMIGERALMPINPEPDPGFLSEPEHRPFTIENGKALIDLCRHMKDKGMT